MFGFGAWAAGFMLHEGRPLWFALTAGVVAGGAVGVAIDRVALWPARLRGAGPLGHNGGLVASAAVLWLVTAVAGPTSAGVVEKVRAAVRLSAPHWSALSSPQLAAATACTIALLAGFFILRASRLGVAMRASASNPAAARAVGIDVEWVYAQATFVAAACGALAGIAFYAVAGSAAWPAAATQVPLAALAAVVVGGIGSPLGVVIAAFGVAAVQFGAGQAWPWLQPAAVPLVLILLACALLPNGLMRKLALRVR